MQAACPYSAGSDWSVGADCALFRLVTADYGGHRATGAGTRLALESRATPSPAGAALLVLADVKRQRGPDPVVSASGARTDPGDCYGAGAACYRGYSYEHGAVSGTGRR